MIKLTALAGFLLLGLAPAQQTIVVDPTGAGDFRGLQAAIDAASPGDTVLVIQGYAGAPEVTINKGIVLMGLGSPTGDGRVAINRITVESVPAGQSLSILNFRLLLYGFTEMCPWIHILNCEGSVSFENFSMTDGSLFVQNSKLVSLSHMESFQSSPLPEVCSGGSISVVGSTAILNNCLFEGMHAWGGFGRGGYSRSAARITDSEVIISNSMLTGGNAAGGIFGSLYSSAAAVELNNSTVRVCSSSIVPGQGGQVVSPSFEGTGTVFSGDEVDRCANLSPEIACSNILMPCVTSSRLFLGEPVDVEMQAPPGGLAILFIARPTAAIATPLGDLWIDLSWTRTLYAGPVGPSGIVAGRIAAVPTGLPVGEKFMIQGGAFDGSRVGLSLPIPLVVN